MPKLQIDTLLSCMTNLQSRKVITYQPAPYRHELIASEQDAVRMLEQEPQDDWLILCVGGQTFQTSLKVLLRNAMLFQRVVKRLSEINPMIEQYDQLLTQTETSFGPAFTAYVSAKEDVVIRITPHMNQIREGVMDLVQDRSTLGKDLSDLKRISTQKKPIESNDRHDTVLLALYEQINLLHSEIQGLKSQLANNSALTGNIAALKEQLANLEFKKTIPT